MKIFRMNDCDWVAAETLDEAKAFYKELTSMDDDDAFDDPAEITDAEMDHLRFHDTEDEPPVVRSFREQLDKIVSDGGEKFPTFFASTEY